MGDILTDVQVYTLYRMKNGTKYRLSGDARKGHEERADSWHTSTPVDSPSLPVLFRRGLIKFASEYKEYERSKYYLVTLTDEGWEKL